MMLCLHLNLSSSQTLVSKYVAFSTICPLPSDYKVGFGGKFGVQTDRQDKSAAGWDHIEKVEKHESQTDHKKGFGGKYGVGVQDKSAVGWEHHEKVDKHESQKGPLLSVQTFVTSCLSSSDYKSGFGGKFGVQNDRVDASAVGWEHHEKVDKHESQKGELCIFSLPICPDIFLPFVLLLMHVVTFSICSRLQDGIRRPVWGPERQSRRQRGRVGPCGEGAKAPQPTG